MTPPLVMKKILTISLTLSKNFYIHITIPQDEPQIETVTPPLITSMVTQNKLKQNPNLSSQASYSLEPEQKTVKLALRHHVWIIAMQEEPKHRMTIILGH